MEHPCFQCTRHMKYQANSTFICHTEHTKCSLNKICAFVLKFINRVQKSTEIVDFHFFCTFILIDISEVIFQASACASRPEACSLVFLLLISSSMLLFIFFSSTFVFLFLLAEHFSHISIVFLRLQISVVYKDCEAYSCTT